MFQRKHIIVPLFAVLVIYTAFMLYPYVIKAAPYFQPAIMTRPFSQPVQQSNWMIQKQLPDVILIGVWKGGTGATITYLSMHPQVAACDHEVKFFAKKYDKGLQWYKEQMPWSSPNQLTMEKSPVYFVTPKVPERIYHMNSNIKLLLTVRDPVVRLISHYVNKGDHKKNILKKFVLDKQGEVNINYGPVNISAYYKHMEKWLKVFERKRIHIIDGDNLIKNPFEEMTAIERFLGIKHIFTMDNFHFNETKGFYCYRTPDKEKCLGEKKGRPHPDVDPMVIRKLRQFFRTI